MTVDRIEGTLSFKINDFDLGIAFKDEEIKTDILYPCVNAMYPG